MSIVSSAIVFEHEQADGSKHVLERHTDSAGLAHPFHYTASPGADTAALLTSHAEYVAAMLATIEFEGAIS